MIYFMIMIMIKHVNGYLRHQETAMLCYDTLRHVVKRYTALCHCRKYAILTFSTRDTSVVEDHMQIEDSIDT